jgi:nitrogenase-associated protein
VAKVVFYGKPGCGTNARQRQMLAAAGHEVEVHSLLSEPWTGERLRAFFGATPVASWFNPASPKVKAGAVDLATLGADEAIALMLADPLLIRRPLVEAEGMRCAGFDRAPVTDLLAAAAALPEACSRPGEAPRCPDPGP